MPFRHFFSGLLRRATAGADQADLKIPEVRLGIIGRSNAGKTALLYALETIGCDAFRSHLQFAAQGVKVAGSMRRSIALREIIQCSPIPPTYEEDERRFCLYDGSEAKIRLILSEIVGRNLMKPKKHPEWFSSYRNHLALADVLWVVIPVLPADALFEEAEQFRHDLHLACGWLREALDAITGQHTVSVAIVPTRIDLVYSGQKEARTLANGDRLLRQLQPLLNTIIRDERILASAVFPTTVFGFGNSVQFNDLGHSSRTSMGDCPDPRHWHLKDFCTASPFNVVPLLLWSLLRGLTEPTGERTGPEESSIEVMLQNELGSSDRWMIPIRQETRPATKKLRLASVSSESEPSRASEIRTETEISGARFHRARHVINVPHVQKTTVISAPVPRVSIDVMGRQHAGKSSLFHALSNDLCLANLPSQLVWSVGNAIETTCAVRSSKAEIARVRLGNLRREQAIQQRSFYLCEGAAKRLRVDTREFTTSAQPIQDQAEHSDDSTSIPESSAPADISGS